MSWRRPTDENALALSFLDLLSCGMGATVLLFLVFSTINRGSIGATSQHENGARGGRSWHVSGVLAPVEVTVSLPEGLERGSFCWIGLDADNVVLDPMDCGDSPSSDRSASVDVFSVTFPDGLPQRAFSVQISNAASIDPEKITASARQAGEERTYKPRSSRAADGQLTFSLDPRTWPAGGVP